MTMTPEELLDAWTAELTEYGEVLMLAEELESLPPHASIRMADALRARFPDEVLVQMFDIATLGYKVKRTGEANHKRWSGPPPMDAEYDHQRNEYWWTRNGTRWTMTAEEADRRTAPRGGYGYGYVFIDETRRFNWADFTKEARKTAEAFRGFHVPHEGTENM